MLNNLALPNNRIVNSDFSLSLPDSVRYLSGEKNRIGGAGTSYPYPGWQLSPNYHYFTSLPTSVVNRNKYRSKFLRIEPLNKIPSGNFDKRQYLPLTTIIPSANMLDLLGKRCVLRFLFVAQGAGKYSVTITDSYMTTSMVLQFDYLAPNTVQEIVFSFKLTDRLFALNMMGGDKLIAQNLLITFCSAIGNSVTNQFNATSKTSQWESLPKDNCYLGAIDDYRFDIKKHYIAVSEVQLTEQVYTEYVNKDSFETQQDAAPFYYCQFTDQVAVGNKNGLVIEHGGNLVTDKCYLPYRAGITGLTKTNPINPLCDKLHLPVSDTSFVKGKSLGVLESKHSKLLFITFIDLTEKLESDIPGMGVRDPFTEDAKVEAGYGYRDSSFAELSLVYTLDNFCRNSNLTERYDSLVGRNVFGFSTPREGLRTTFIKNDQCTVSLSNSLDSYPMNYQDPLTKNVFCEYHLEEDELKPYLGKQLVLQFNLGTSSEGEIKDIEISLIKPNGEHWKNFTFTSTPIKKNNRYYPTPEYLITALITLDESFYQLNPIDNFQYGGRISIRGDIARGNGVDFYNFKLAINDKPNEVDFLTLLPTIENVPLFHLSQATEKVYANTNLFLEHEGYLVESWNSPVVKGSSPAYTVSRDETKLTYNGTYLGQNTFDFIFINTTPFITIDTKFLTNLPTYIRKIPYLNNHHYMELAINEKNSKGELLYFDFTDKSYAAAGKCKYNTEDPAIGVCYRRLTREGDAGQQRYSYYVTVNAFSLSNELIEGKKYGKLFISIPNSGFTRDRHDIITLPVLEIFNYHTGQAEQYKLSPFNNKDGAVILKESLESYIQGTPSKIKLSFWYCECTYPGYIYTPSNSDFSPSVDLTKYLDTKDDNNNRIYFYPGWQGIHDTRQVFTPGSNLIPVKRLKFVMNLASALTNQLKPVTSNTARYRYSDKTPSITMPDGIIEAKYIRGINRISSWGIFLELVPIMNKETYSVNPSDHFLDVNPPTFEIDREFFTKKEFTPLYTIWSTLREQKGISPISVKPTEIIESTIKNIEVIAFKDREPITIHKYPVVITNTRPIITKQPSDKTWTYQGVQPKVNVVAHDFDGKPVKIKWTYRVKDGDYQDGGDKSDLIIDATTLITTGEYEAVASIIGKHRTISTDKVSFSIRSAIPEMTSELTVTPAKDVQGKEHLFQIEFDIKGVSATSFTLLIDNKNVLTTKTNPVIFKYKTDDIKEHEASVVATNSYGSTSSNFVKFTTTSAKPLITKQPTSISTIKADAFKVLISTTTYDYPATYSWLLDGKKLSGFTKEDLILNAQQCNDLFTVGSHKLNAVVSTKYGTTTSKDIPVTVKANNPVILTQPSSDIAFFLDGKGVMSVKAKGVHNEQLLYTWYRQVNGQWKVLKEGADSVTLVGTDFGIGHHPIKVVIKSTTPLYQSTTSNTVTFNVKDNKPVIDKQPHSNIAEIYQGISLEYSVKAHAVDGRSIRYQWYTVDGKGAKTALAGETSSKLNVINFVPGTYHLTCKVYTDKAFIFTDTVVIKIKPADITNQRILTLEGAHQLTTGDWVEIGKTVKFKALCENPSGHPLTYKWIINGGKATGQEVSSKIIAPTTGRPKFTAKVEISNKYVTVVSDEVELIQDSLPYFKTQPKAPSKTTYIGDTISLTSVVSSTRHDILKNVKFNVDWKRDGKTKLGSGASLNYKATARGVLKFSATATSPIGSVNSNTVSVQVKAQPSITSNLVAIPNNVFVGGYEQYMFKCILKNQDELPLHVELFEGSNVNDESKPVKVRCECTIGNGVATVTSDHIKSSSRVGVKKYWMKITNPDNGYIIRSAVASVTLKDNRPVITAQPNTTFKTVYQGTIYELSVTAHSVDNRPLKYQWMKGITNSSTKAVPIKGATSSTFNTKTLNVGDYYIYCDVSTDKASISTLLVRIKVINSIITNARTVITVDGKVVTPNTWVEIGKTVKFKALCENPSKLPLSYKWSADGLKGSRTSAEITTVVGKPADMYGLHDGTCTITNGYTEAKTKIVGLYHEGKPSIWSQVSANTTHVTPGSKLTLQCYITTPRTSPSRINPMLPLYFTWYEGNNGDTSKVVQSKRVINPGRYTVSGKAQDGYCPTLKDYKPTGAGVTRKYWCRVENQFGHVDTSAISIKIGWAAPTWSKDLYLQPGQVFRQGERNVLTVQGNANGAPNPKYEWFILANGSSTSGTLVSSTNSLDCGFDKPVGNYLIRCRFTTSGGSIWSNVITVKLTSGAPSNGELQTPPTTSPGIFYPNDPISSYTKMNSLTGSCTIEWFLGNVGDTRTKIATGENLLYRTWNIGVLKVWVRYTNKYGSWNYPTAITWNIQDPNVALLWNQSPRNTTSNGHGIDSTINIRTNAANLGNFSINVSLVNQSGYNGYNKSFTVSYGRGDNLKINPPIGELRYVGKLTYKITVTHPHFQMSPKVLTATVVVSPWLDIRGDDLPFYEMSDTSCSNQLPLGSLIEGKQYFWAKQCWESAKFNNYPNSFMRFYRTDGNSNAQVNSPVTVRQLNGTLMRIEGVVTLTEGFAWKGSLQLSSQYGKQTWYSQEFPVKERPIRFNGKPTSSPTHIEQFDNYTLRADIYNPNKLPITVKCFNGDPRSSHWEVGGLTLSGVDGNGIQYARATTSTSNVSSGLGHPYYFEIHYQGKVITSEFVYVKVVLKQIQALCTLENRIWWPSPRPNQMPDTFYVTSTGRWSLNLLFTNRDDPSWKVEVNHRNLTDNINSLTGPIISGCHGEWQLWDWRAIFTDQNNGTSRTITGTLRVRHTHYVRFRKYTDGSGFYALRNDLKVQVMHSLRVNQMYYKRQSREGTIQLIDSATSNIWWAIGNDAKASNSFRQISGYNLYRNSHDSLFNRLTNAGSGYFTIESL